MTKSAIGKIFAGGILAVAAGLVLLAASGIQVASNMALVVDGQDAVQPQWAGAWAGMLALASFAMLTVVAGGIALLVAWIGALMNTLRTDDRTWFVAVLLLGLVSFGTAGALVYVLAGPEDGVEAARGGLGGKPLPAA